jgi:hypothetical protein
VDGTFSAGVEAGGLDSSLMREEMDTTNTTLSDLFANFLINEAGGQPVS